MKPIMLKCLWMVIGKKSKCSYAARPPEVDLFMHVVTSLLQTLVSRLILPAIFEHAGVLENGRHKIYRKCDHNTLADFFSQLS